MSEITVSIPGPLRANCDSLFEIKLLASTVRGALTDLANRFPRLKSQLFDDRNGLRRAVNVFLNEADIRFFQISDPALRPGDRIDIILAISGG